jgi:putative FmdB family regulatory protein
MPIYEYICLDCGNQFDALRTMSAADEPISCQQCNSEHTSRMLSVFYAQSGGKAVAGGNTLNCTACSSKSCSTCGV